MKKYLAIVVAAALLSACGGGGSYGGSSGDAGGYNNGSSSSGSVADTFTNAIAVLVAMMSEESSPTSIDSYTATSAEDTSPGQVM